MKGVENFHENEFEGRREIKARLFVSVTNPKLSVLRRMRACKCGGDFAGGSYAVEIGRRFTTDKYRISLYLTMG